MDSSAQRPSFVASLPAKKEETEETMTDNERFLYGLTQTSGWPIFTRRKDELLHDMDNLQDMAIANGVSKEEIGGNAIIISMAKGVINRLWKIVEDSKDVYEGTK